MPSKASSKVDIVTWLINVKHPWRAETEDHWANPSQYAFMREVLHESVHFWQALGLPYFLRISFHAYKDFQRVRASAFEQSQDGGLIPVDQLQLEPNRSYFAGYQALNHPYGKGGLSGADIIEGMARYWDIHLCGMRHALDRIKAEGEASDAEIEAAQAQYGPFLLPDGLHYTDAAIRFIFDVERRYNRAYAFALDTVGEEAFILFPILGFLALSRGSQSVSSFQRWLGLYADTRPFVIPPGNFLLAWQNCFSQAFQWIVQQLGEPIYSSLTVYRHLGKQMIGWSLSTSLAQRFGLMTGQGVLDRYMHNYWQWMRAEHPAIPDEDVELQLHPAFCMPGNPLYRERLLYGFHPPVILFADGKAWVDEANWQSITPQLEDELIRFAGMLGAAVALSGEFGKKLPVQCPHTACPWNGTMLCWKVARFPDKVEDCVMPDLYRTQMNLDLPTDPNWDIGQIDRPIVQKKDELLAIELH